MSSGHSGRDDDRARVDLTAPPSDRVADRHDGAGQPHEHTAQVGEDDHDEHVHGAHVHDDAHEHRHDHDHDHQHEHGGPLGWLSELFGGHSHGAPAAGTATAASPVRITAAQIGPTDSTITVQNTSGSAVDMSGWRLRVGSATATLPANSRVAANDTATIHTASGTSSGKDIYLGQDATALLAGLQPGATVALLNAQGTSVAEFTLPR